MTQSAAYCLSGAQDSRLIISHDELRSLFDQVESEFCQSDIYQKAFRGLHKRLGSTPKWVQPLIKAIGREAIRLTLRQLVTQYQSELNHVTQPSSHAVKASTESVPSSSDSKVQREPSVKPSKTDSALHMAASRATLSVKEAVDSTKETVDSTLPKKVEHVKARIENEVKASLPVCPPPPPSAITRTTATDDPARAIAPSSAPFPSSALLRKPPTAHIQKHSASDTPNKNSPTSSDVKVASKSTSPILSTHQKQKPETSKQTHPYQVTHQTVPHQTVTKATHQTITPKAPDVDPVLQSIGAALAKARIEKKLTVHDVYAQTRIAPHQIEAIEAGYLDKLPEKIYVKGFIRQIALFVGLDYTTLIQSWSSDNVSTTHVPQWVVPASKPTQQNQKSVRPAHLYLGYAALMVSAAGGLVWANQNQSTVSLEGLDFPVDIPQVLDQLTSRFRGDEQGTQRSRYHRDQMNSGAISTPEIVTVESSAPSTSISTP